jgi:hypothetical protein
MPRAVTELDIRDERTETKGPLGLVARVIAQSVELAEGRGLFRIEANTAPHLRDPGRLMEQERDWLRGPGLVAFLTFYGFDPAPVRAELRRRFDWMRK